MEPANTIDGIPIVIISPEGIFKYILIQVFISNKLVGYLLRGSTKFQYHAENYGGFVEELKSLGFQSVKQKKVKGKEVTAKKGKN